jgi:hypothetical protein
MIQEHPITPPPDELVEQWREDNLTPENLANYVATQAARWGADQELEACCSLLELSDDNAREFLQSARRPKPLSLKEQALEEIGVFEGMGTCNIDIIRRALESLPD